MFNSISTLRWNSHVTEHIFCIFPGVAMGSISCDVNPLREETQVQQIPKKDVEHHLVEKN